MAVSSAKLANRILAGLAIGLLAGLLTLGIGQGVPEVLALARQVSTAVFDPLGQVFFRLLFFVVIPLVFASLASGVAQLGDLSRLGPLAGRTFSLFGLNMVIGVVLGLVMMNALQPGGFIAPEARDALLKAYAGDAAKHVATSEARADFSLMTVVDMFMPRNLFGTVAGFSRTGLGEVLPLILFSLLVGAAATQLAPASRQRVLDGLDSVTQLMTGIVGFALRLAPYAVPVMIYSVVVRIGLDLVIALAVFVLGVLGVLALHLFGTMSVLLKVGSRRWQPVAFFRAVRPVLITAFSTSSSNATLPASMAVARDTLRVRPSTAGFVIPLGATMNMSGTALFEGCVVLFVAQVFGVNLGFMAQLTLLVLAVLTAVAVAGIPGGSLPLIAGLCVTFGIPPEGIAIVLGVDRLLDMARTTVNVGADLVTAVIVDEKSGPLASENQGHPPTV
ncbi:MAG: dicarboxylate/amino acid:cation symporter [Verrucomicrobia bacterium]|nr:MAG: dicarboxylate/amino acid:cation symporter [Verrucomicrobiota bacterium]